ncbi:MAG TPA: cyclic nucleotide-binding domain-containing protein [Myxococcota bacterium]|nr:cyclic nucleotide-binding domain-containing protein [Myxococcota bacterium]
MSDAKSQKGDPADVTRLVAASPLGAELTKEQCAALAELVELRRVAPRSFLIEEGTSDDSVHVLLAGALEVLKNAGPGEPASLSVLRPGDLAGEMSFIDGMRHQTGLRAIAESEVLSLRREAFEKLVAKDPDLVYKVMRAIMRAAHELMHRMNFQYIELSNYIFKQHGRY